MHPYFAWSAHTLPSSILKWCADTGATSHTTPNREWFQSYKPLTVSIHVAD